MEEVCVVLLSPITLDRTVTVRVSSQDITANGKIGTYTRTVSITL